METKRFARAKVNLFLHVGALGDDGYHPLASLITFADVGDMVRMRPSEEMEFRIEGPFAGELSADGENLVTRARDLAMDWVGLPGARFRLTLDKRLPIASGVGGGSADAAATLQLIADSYAPHWFGGGDESPVFQLAAQLGSDVPVCLDSRPMLALGRGDELEYPPLFPDLEAVLVNPLLPSPTGAVYRAYDDAGAPGDEDAPEWPEAMDTVEDVVAFLADCRNDLEAPAISLQPAIGEVLRVLKARPETLLARMSGSGATCFAICADERDRHDLAFALKALYPQWWVAGCRLAGFSP